MTSGRSSAAPRKRCRGLLPTFIVLCGALSVLNIAYHHFAHDQDVARAAEELFKSNFLSTTGERSARRPGPGPAADADADAGARSPPKPGADDDGGGGGGRHVLAGLSCAQHGGPADDVASEMVFWSDVPSDSKYRSPWFGGGNRTKYLTFEPDHGGWNNIRMAMETVLVLAHATGRTLVLPPENKMYLLTNDWHKHKTSFSFNDFFHLDSIAVEHDGIDVITMEEFLRREAASGRLSAPPPEGRLDWNGRGLSPLWGYLRAVGRVPSDWGPDECVLGIPATPDPEDVGRLRKAHAEAMRGGKPEPADFVGKPTPVDAPVVDRLREMMGGREKICVYDVEMQREPLLHLKVDHGDDARLLTHFYAFLFFQDWRHDLYYKRFVRDHVRYIDEIVCAAARIVHAVRQKAKAAGSAEGIYDSMHVRRGDFQYRKTRIPAEELFERSKEELTEGATLYIATDERDKSFFGPIKAHYNVLFLDDFREQLGEINTNYFGMLDQLVASRGRVFYGTWWSTLSGYINRMRGYYITKHHLQGYEDGTMQSFYFIPDDRKLEMREYRSVRLPIYMREFPTSWRDIDKGVKEVHLAGEDAALAKKSRR